MLAGSLSEFSIPDIFSLLAATRKTGVLGLTGCPTPAPSDADVHGRVWILDGAPAYAVADSTRAPLAARLLHSGELAVDAVEPLVRAQSQDDPTQPAAALSAAGLAEERIAQVLRDQVVDAVFDLSRWAGGSFSFESAPAATDTSAPVVAPAEVLAAVEARTAEWEGIVAQLPSPASVLAVVSRPPAQSGGMVQMSAERWEVITLVDGLRSVADLIALTGQGQFVAARLLAGLVADGVLAVREDAGAEPPSQVRAAHLARLEHELLGAPARPQAAAIDVHALLEHGTPAPVETADPEGEAVAKRMRELAALGVGDTSDRQVEGEGAVDAADTHDAVAGASDLLGATTDTDARQVDPVPNTADGDANRAANSELLARLIDGVKGV